MARTLRDLQVAPPEPAAAAPPTGRRRSRWRMLFALPAIVLALLGLGSFVGAAGEVFGQLNLNQAAAELNQAAAEAPDVDQLLGLVRDGAWQTLLVLLLTAGAAALGGVVGARPELRTRWSRMVVVRPRV